MATFVVLFQQLIAGDLPADVSREMCGYLERAFRFTLPDYPSPGGYYDGIGYAHAKRRKPLQLQLEGEIWIYFARGGGAFPFQARITDKRSTKQGVHLSLSVRDQRAETTLEEIDVIVAQLKRQKRPPGAPDGLLD